MFYLTLSYSVYLNFKTFYPKEFLYQNCFYIYSTSSKPNYGELNIWLVLLLLTPLANSAKFRKDLVALSRPKVAQKNYEGKFAKIGMKLINTCLSRLTQIRLICIK